MHTTSPFPSRQFFARREREKHCRRMSRRAASGTPHAVRHAQQQAKQAHSHAAASETSLLIYPRKGKGFRAIIATRYTKIARMRSPFSLLTPRINTPLFLQKRAPLLPPRSSNQHSSLLFPLSSLITALASSQWSINTMAVMASTTGTARRAAHMSCRP